MIFAQLAGLLVSLRNKSWYWPFAILAVGCLATCVAILISLVAWPVPRIHDEFSHLLLADTLRHGRLSNPTPSVWQPIQSFHTIVLPTYSSKYPLGPGLLLALGWNLTGTPAAGLWFGAGLCAAATTWMLAAAMPRRWAMLGGLVVALHPSMQVDWSRSYMNGWLAATSATVMLGALLRLRRRATARDATVLGIGVGLIALCRPYEGLMATLITGCMLLAFWSRLPRIQLARNLARTVGFAAPGVILAFGVMALHNRATTGCWHTMPYQVHEQQYAVAPLFITQAKRTPVMFNESNHQIPSIMLRFHEGWSYESYKRRASLVGWLGGIVERAHLVFFYWGVSLVGVPLVLSRYWSRWRVSSCCALGIVILVMATSLVPWTSSHYLAPILPWLVLLAVCGLRHSSRRFARRKILVAGVVALQVVLLGHACITLSRATGGEWAKRRSEIEASLAASGGKHLVLVRYSENHNYHQEWVYNLANLDSSPVIWARSDRKEWDAALLEEFAADRSIWVLYPDQPHPELIRF